MSKLKIVGKSSTKDSITRTIRISGERVVNQLLEYGLKNIG